MGLKNWSKIETLTQLDDLSGVSHDVIDRSIQPPQISAISCRQPSRWLRCDRGLRIGSTIEAARPNDLDTGGFRADQKPKGCDQRLRLRACRTQKRAARAFRHNGLVNHRRVTL